MRASLILLSLVIAICGCENRQKPREQAIESKPKVDTVVPAKPAAAPELGKLKGNWMRADGDYVLEIGDVDAAGQLTAHYFNPNPIRVSKALGMLEGSTTKVFIELQDTGYPGCTYSLTYDASVDQLHGQYYQAAMQQTYDVVFARAKKE